MRIKALLVSVAALAVPAAAGSEDASPAIAYICRAEQQAPPSGPKALTILPGMGSGGFKIATASREAQAWFDYGLQLYHAFYHEEAKQAFDKAAALDPNCAMCAWGRALSQAATMNYGIQPEQAKAALALADKAAELAVDDKEKRYAAIMQARLKTGDEAAYGEAMSAFSRAHPADDQIAELAAHAVMIGAWRGGKDKAEKAIALLEPVLKRSPNDTAAIHYYIHATEFAGRPAAALPYAERLAALSPDASHLVHMAAHTLFRVGRYQEVALVNANAMAVDARTGSAWGYQRKLGEAYYYGHNYAFGMAGAMMAGDAGLSLKYADHAKAAFPSGAVGRFASALPRSYVAYARFAPDQALKIGETAKPTALERIMRHYARGEAFALRGEVRRLRAERRQLARIKAGGGDATMARLAVLVLDGRDDMLSGRPKDAARAFAEAADLQDRVQGNSFDPPPWWYPIRRSAAAARLESGDLDGAERDAKASLEVWREDPMAILVLSEVERRRGHGAQATAQRSRAAGLWRGDLDKVSLKTL